MKIVIDLPEEYSKHYKRIYADSDGWTYDAGKGVPLSEVIEDIKSEIAWHKDDKISHAEVNEMIDVVLEIIDRHISGKENT